MRRAEQEIRIIFWGFMVGAIIAVALAFVFLIAVIVTDALTTGLMVAFVVATSVALEVSFATFLAAAFVVTVDKMENKRHDANKKRRGNDKADKSRLCRLRHILRAQDIRYYIHYNFICSRQAALKEKTVFFKLFVIFFMIIDSLLIYNDAACLFYSAIPVRACGIKVLKNLLIINNIVNKNVRYLPSFNTSFNTIPQLYSPLYLFIYAYTKRPLIRALNFFTQATRFHTFLTLFRNYPVGSSAFLYTRKDDGAMGEKSEDAKARSERAKARWKSTGVDRSRRRVGCDIVRAKNVNSVLIVHDFLRQVVLRQFSILFFKKILQSVTTCLFSHIILNSSLYIQYCINIINRIIRDLQHCLTCIYLYLTNRVGQCCPYYLHQYACAKRPLCRALNFFTQATRLYPFPTILRRNYPVGSSAFLYTRKEEREKTLNLIIITIIIVINKNNYFLMRQVNITASSKFFVRHPLGLLKQGYVGLLVFFMREGVTGRGKLRLYKTKMIILNNKLLIYIQQ